jgi:hypothetical protein
VNGERRAWYLYIPCLVWYGMAGPMGEGGVRYWVVKGGWVGVAGEETPKS